MERTLLLSTKMNVSSFQQGDWVAQIYMEGGVLSIVVLHSVLFPLCKSNHIHKYPHILYMQDGNYDLSKGTTFYTLLLVFIKLTNDAVDIARRIISFSVLRFDVVDFSIKVRSNTFSSVLITNDGKLRLQRFGTFDTYAIGSFVSLIWTFIIDLDCTVSGYFPKELFEDKF